jgi:hypothetical protein
MTSSAKSVSTRFGVLPVSARGVLERWAAGTLSVDWTILELEKLAPLKDVVGVLAVREIADSFGVAWELPGGAPVMIRRARRCARESSSSLSR